VWRWSCSWVEWNKINKWINKIDMDMVDG
jgi:hypothetical protein